MLEVYPLISNSRLALLKLECNAKPTMQKTIAWYDIKMLYIPKSSGVRRRAKRGSVRNPIPLIRIFAMVYPTPALRILFIRSNNLKYYFFDII